MSIELHGRDSHRSISRGFAFVEAVSIVALVPLAIGVSLNHRGVFSGFSSLYAGPRGHQFLVFAAAIAVVQLAVRWLSSIRPMVAICGAYCLLASHSVGVLPVVTTVVVYLSWYFLGWRVFGTRCSGDGTNAVVVGLVCIAVGMAITSHAVLLLVHTKINTQGLYWILTLFPIVLFGRRFVGSSWSHRSFRSAMPREESLKTVCLEFLLLLLLALYAIMPLVPEMGFDQLCTHLMVPESVSIHDTLDIDVYAFAWAYMPMAADMIFTQAVVMCDAYGARLVNVVFLFLVLLGMHAVLLEHGCRRSVPVGAMISILVVPVGLWMSISLFVEYCLTFVVFTALLSFSRAVETRDPSWCFVTFALVGFACSIKATAVFFAAILGLLAFIEIYPELSRLTRFRTVTISIIILVLMACPYYVKAFIATGNPVFPFFNQIFRSELFETSKPMVNSLFTSGCSWKTLYDLTFATERFIEGPNGHFGYFIIYAVPCSIVGYRLLGQRPWRYWIPASCVALIAVFSHQSYLRYIWPFFPMIVVFLWVVFAKMLDRYKIARAVWWTVFGLSVFLGVKVLINFNWWYDKVPLDEVLNPGLKSEFQLRCWPERYFIDYVNERYGNNAFVVFLTNPFVATLHGRAVTDSWHAYQFLKEISTLQDDEEREMFLKKLGVTHVLARNPIDERPRRALSMRFLESRMRKELVRDSITLYTWRDVQP